MTNFNQHQPDRPRIHPTRNLILRYRTFPSVENKILLKVTDWKSMIAQARLYRFVRSGLMENGMGIGDVHDFLFYDQLMISKKLMGMIVVQTVMYNPRHLLGVSQLNPKNTVLYMFNDLLDFQYGLEWMICTWLRKFLNSLAAPGSKLVLGLHNELDILANSSDSEYIDIYEEGLREFKIEEPKWEELVSGHMEEIPVPSVVVKPRDRPVVPKSRIRSTL